MNKKVTFKELFHEAGIAGLVLTPLCIVEFIAGWKLFGIESVWATIIVDALKVIKIVGCIWILRFYMNRFYQGHPDCTRTDVRRMGTFSGFLSALILAALSMAYFEWHPELIRAVMDQAYQMVGQNNMMTSENREALRVIEQSYPQISFWSEVIRCTFIGWIFSIIIARRLVPNNPFQGNNLSTNE